MDAFVGYHLDRCAPEPPNAHSHGPEPARDPLSLLAVEAVVLVSEVGAFDPLEIRVPFKEFGDVQELVALPLDRIFRLEWRWRPNRDDIAHATSFAGGETSRAAVPTRWQQRVVPHS